MTVITNASNNYRLSARRGAARENAGRGDMKRKEW
jgi:hypothetical protein